MARRSPEDWHRLLEAHGWRDQAGLAKRLGCSLGTVASGSKRAREWAERQGLASDDGGIASGASKPTRRIKDRQARRLDGLSPQQIVAVEAVVAGCRPSEAAALAGVAPETVSRWLHHDPLVAAAVSDLRAERHVATMSALTSLAQELVGHHSAAARLVRTLIDQASDRLHNGPPPLPTGDMGAEDAVAAVIARKVWHLETRAAVDQAVKAAGLLNASPILATGGYPKTERVEHSGEVTDGDARRDPDEVMARLTVLRGGLDG